MAADVPSPIDFRRMTEARCWADTAMVRRPWRVRFFADIADEIRSLGSPALSILELGSGPGFLARCILQGVPGASYVALDWSPAMHVLARERLGEKWVDRIRFVEVDFKKPDWTVTLDCFDFIVTVQAVHELRHKEHAPGFFRRVRSILRPSGVFLMCDHFMGDGGMSDDSLFMTPAEHVESLHAGGFGRVELLRQEGGMVLYRASEQRM